MVKLGMLPENSLFMRPRAVTIPTRPKGTDNSTQRQFIATEDQQTKSKSNHSQQIMVQVGTESTVNDILDLLFRPGFLRENLVGDREQPTVIEDWIQSFCN